MKPPKVIDISQCNSKFALSYGRWCLSWIFQESFLHRGMVISTSPSNHGFPGAQVLAGVCGINHLVF